MVNLTLYFAPETCAIVPLIAFEKIGYPYKIEVIALMKTQNRSPAFRSHQCSLSQESTPDFTPQVHPKSVFRCNGHF